MEHEKQNINKNEEQEIQTAIETCSKFLCCSLDADSWITRNPEKAAALMETVGLLEDEIKTSLLNYVRENDLCFLHFVTLDGNKAWFIPSHDGEQFQMEYEESDN